MYIVDIQEMVSIELVQVSSIMYLYTKKYRRACWQIELNLFTGCENRHFSFLYLGKSSWLDYLQVGLGADDDGNDYNFKPSFGLDWMNMAVQNLSVALLAFLSAFGDNDDAYDDGNDDNFKPTYSLASSGLLSAGRW